MNEGYRSLRDLMRKISVYYIHIVRLLEVPLGAVIGRLSVDVQVEAIVEFL
jgi:hypothetical protein